MTDPSTLVSESQLSPSSSSTQVSKQSSRPKVKTHFKLSWLLEYGLEILSGNAQTLQVQVLGCRFCEAGRDPVSGKSGRQGKRHIFRCKNFKYPFRADNIRRHMDKQHGEQFKFYRSLDDSYKKIYFDGGDRLSPILSQPSNNNNNLTTMYEQQYNPTSVYPTTLPQSQPMAMDFGILQVVANLPTTQNQLDAPNPARQITPQQQTIQYPETVEPSATQLQLEALLKDLRSENIACGPVARLQKAKASARAAEIDGLAAIRKAELEAQADRVAYEGRLLQLKEERIAHSNRLQQLKEEHEMQLDYAKQKAELEVAKRRHLNELEIEKFHKTIGSIGRDQLVQYAQQGSTEHARVLELLSMSMTSSDATETNIIEYTA